MRAYFYLLLIIDLILLVIITIEPMNMVCSLGLVFVSLELLRAFDKRNDKLNRRKVIQYRPLSNLNNLYKLKF